MIEVKAQQSQILCSERQRRGEGPFECESALRERAGGRAGGRVGGKKRNSSAEINTCFYGHWAAGVGHVDASRKLRSVRDHTDAHAVVATPRSATCALCQEVPAGDEWKSCPRLTDIPTGARTHVAQTHTCSHTEEDRRTISKTTLPQQNVDVVC